MSMRRSWWGWIGSVAVAIGMLALIFENAVTGSISMRPAGRYVLGGVDPWDHKLRCSVAEAIDDGKNLDSNRSEVFGEPTDVFLWIRGSKYFVASDASFMKAKFQLRAYSSSYWNEIEEGSGNMLCLDSVSTVAGKRLDYPYCALSVDMGTLEYLAMKIDNAHRQSIHEIGQCELLRSATPS